MEPTWLQKSAAMVLQYHGRPFSTAVLVTRERRQPPFGLPPGNDTPDPVDAQWVAREREQDERISSNNLELNRLLRLATKVST